MWLSVQGTTNVTLLARALHPLDPPSDAPFQPNRFWVYVDGVQTATIVDTSSWGNYTVESTLVAEGLNPAVPHVILLVKITEAQWNDRDVSPNYLVLSGFLLDAGSTLPAPALPTRRIEFVGDSITAGYCNLCQVDPGSNGYQAQSFALAWPYLTCGSLDATCHTIAWSGMGLVSGHAPV